MTIINSVLASVPEAIAAFKTGETVIIVDDETRENEGDLAIAGEFVTPEAVNFFAREGRGLICFSMAPALIDRFNLPLMVPQEENQSGFGTPFTVSVEARHGVTTGISAHDRDDISGIGQTQAAHDLCTNIPDGMKIDYIQKGVGHYGVFNGSRWRTQIQPKIRDFIRQR